MGNIASAQEVEIPKPHKILSDAVFFELKIITLESLRECIYLWKTEVNVEFVNDKEFDNLFGHLVKDPDIHFAVFRHEFEAVVTVWEYLVVAILVGNAGTVTLYR